MKWKSGEYKRKIIGTNFQQGITFFKSTHMQLPQSFFSNFERYKSRRRAHAGNYDHKRYYYTNGTHCDPIYEFLKVFPGSNFTPVANLTPLITPFRWTYFPLAHSSSSGVLTFITTSRETGASRVKLLTSQKTSHSLHIQFSPRSHGTPLEFIPLPHTQPKNSLLLHFHSHPLWVFLHSIPSSLFLQKPLMELQTHFHGLLHFPLPCTLFLS
jgi:hypothetical protein